MNIIWCCDVIEIHIIYSRFPSSYEYALSFCLLITSKTLLLQLTVLCTLCCFFTFLLNHKIRLLFTTDEHWHFHETDRRLRARAGSSWLGETWALRVLRLHSRISINSVTEPHVDIHSQSECWTVRIILFVLSALTVRYLCVTRNARFLRGNSVATR